MLEIWLYYGTTRGQLKDIDLRIVWMKKANIYATSAEKESKREGLFQLYHGKL